ncbi:MAG TPA: hypothetical protein VGF23_03155 [Gaiellaceae bacterium]|jgi:hypothetical protein
MRFQILVDGRRRATVKGRPALRTWVEKYRSDHPDDPGLTHVQVLEAGPLALLRGGRLLRVPDDL